MGSESVRFSKGHREKAAGAHSFLSPQTAIHRNGTPGGSVTFEKPDFISLREFISSLKPTRQLRPESRNEIELNFRVEGILAHVEPDVEKKNGKGFDHLDARGCCTANLESINSHM